MSESEEKKNQRLGLLSSLGIHVAMILLFIFVMGWKAPNPPLGEAGSGIELNFGLDDQGSGDIQPEVPVGNPESTPEEKKEAVEQKQQEEKVKEEVKPEDSKDKPLTSEEESPVVVKETKKETKILKEVKEKPVDNKAKENVAEIKKEKEEKKVVKESDARKPAEEKKGAGVSQGDDKGKTGDKGSPTGTLDAKALYGKQGTGGGDDGGGGGGGISISGFEGFDRPNIAKPEIPNESYGTYKFKVKVSKEGEVISIQSLIKGSNPEAERIFRTAIENTEFIAKVSNLKEQVEGTITFKVVAPPTK
jgi:periplasmic protein TonB